MLNTCLIDPAINDPLQIVTGCLCPAPADNLPILAGIQPAKVRCSGATLLLGCCAMEPGHLLHSALTCPSSENTWRLKLRHPFVPAAQHLISSSDNNMRVVQWRITNGMRSGRATPQDSYFHPRHRQPPGMTLPRRAWVQLNCLGIGHFRSSLYKLGTLLLVQMWYGLLCDLWVLCRRTNCRLCCLPMSNPSTSPWAAWPAGSGWWDNQMAAQHLPRDLVRRSSGLNSWLKRRRV